MWVGTQARGPGSTPAAPGAQNSPGHHQELVDLLVYERVVCLPHLGLQSGLVSAILLTYKKRNGDASKTLRPRGLQQGL